MKTLLLTDMPPCEAYSGGLVLAALVRLLPRGSVCCFAVLNPNIPAAMGEEFSGVPIEFHAKPNENWRWLPQRFPLRKVSALVSHAGEQIIERTVVRRRIDQAIAFGRAQEVDRVWAVLQGQTTIRMARAVARCLGVPLHTHVWDPFSWWAKANRLDGRTTRQVHAEFDAALSESVRIAAASQPMADLYEERYGRPALPVISSHRSSLARAPDVSPGVGDTVLIGMAGQFYAADEWRHLVRAMNAARWQVDGRPVRIVVLGPQHPPDAPSDKVTFLGWKTQDEAAEIMSCCDILYCPYPFDPGMEEVSRYSFPSKLVLYLAAGRPVVFHGPAYSAPAQYIEERGCGVAATRIAATAIYNEIERLVLEPDLYAAAGSASQKAFLDDFTLEAMARAFRTFLDAPGGDDATAQDHRAQEGDARWPDRLPERDRARVLPVIGLAGGRALRRSGLRARGLLRRAALVLPPVRRLQRELHRLYAENAMLKEQLTEVAGRSHLPLQAASAGTRTAPGRDGYELSASGKRILDELQADSALFLGPSAELAPLFLDAADLGRAPSRIVACAVTLAPEGTGVGGRPEEINLAAGKLPEGDWDIVREAVPREAVQTMVRLAVVHRPRKITLVAEGEADHAVVLALSTADLLGLGVALAGPHAVEDASWLTGRKAPPHFERIPRDREDAGTGPVSAATGA